MLKSVLLWDFEGVWIEFLVDPTELLHERVGHGHWWIPFNAVFPHICITQIQIPHHLPHTAVTFKASTKAYHQYSYHPF